VSERQGFTDAGVSGQKQDAAPAFDVLQPGCALFYRVGVQGIAGFDVLVKGEVFEREPG
jgi:hypothetical protein